jgi:hypothetical protein
MRELLCHSKTSIHSLRCILDARRSPDIGNTMFNFWKSSSHEEPFRAFGRIESRFIRLGAARVLTCICLCMVSEKDKPWYDCHATRKRTYDK